MAPFSGWMAFPFSIATMHPVKKKKGPLCTEASRVKPAIGCLQGTWRRRSSDSVKETRMAEMKQQLWMFLCLLLLMFMKGKGGRKERRSTQKGISCLKLILIKINTYFSSQNIIFLLFKLMCVCFVREIKTRRPWSIEIGMNVTRTLIVTLFLRVKFVT